MLLNRICLVLATVFWFAHALHASDGDTTRTRQSKELGLGVSALYSATTMKAKAYFIGDNVGTPQLENTPGFSAGFYYNFYAGRKLIVRPGVEAVLLPVTIAYQTEIDYVTRQRIFPTTLELPLTILYSSYRIDAFPRPKGRPEYGIGLRPVVAVKTLSDAQPVMRTNNLNLDAVVGFPVGSAKSVMRVELFYSYGLFNLIGEDNNYKTRSITSLYRHFGGLRLIFH